MSKIGEVYQNKETLEKFVIRGPKGMEKVSASEWEKVADTPHGDDDFSYMCGSNYCRCTQ